MKSVPWVIFLFACIARPVLAQSETNNAPTPPPAASTASAPVISAPATVSAATSSPPSVAIPSSTVSGTVTSNSPQATNAPVNLTEDQKEKIRRMLQQQKLNEEQRKRAAELLDKTPPLDKMKNPNVTETQSIPKRF